MACLPEIESVPNVCEVTVVSAPDATGEAPPDLLIEAPHGATRSEHFTSLRRRLVGSYPDDLQDFFFVNTDVGSSECARMTAELVTGRRKDPRLEHLVGTRELRRPSRVLIVRNLIPRTFIDCNRFLGVDADEFREARLTPAIPEYVTHEADIETLQALHRSYQTVVERAYEWVCGNDGSALVLHTYAPKHVRIDRIDGNIGALLRKAYDPEQYETWKSRPDVDIISESTDGAILAPADRVASVVEGYAKLGIRATQNASYRLHPSTAGYFHSAKYPTRVLCLELNRGCLADPFSPFEEMRIGDDRVRRMSLPIAAVYR